MLYYGLISLCAVMFSSQFFFDQMYQKSYGSGLMAVVVKAIGSAIVGIVVLSVINGFQFGCTPFSLFMATISTITSMISSFCTLKAFEKTGLSLYSTFTMLGGMALPFIFGILFFDEALTIGKIICFVFISVALFFTVKPGERKSKGIFFCVCNFVLNGLFGVFTKVYQALPFEKVSASQYSILYALTSLCISLILLLFVKGEKKKLNIKSIFAISGSSILNRVANLWLLISLSVLPASAQYPFITGGTMIASTIIAYITHQKPKKREIVSVVLSFVGIMALILVP